MIIRFDIFLPFHLYYERSTDKLLAWYMEGSGTVVRTGLLVMTIWVDADSKRGQFGPVHAITVYLGVLFKRTGFLGCSEMYSFVHSVILRIT